jgi:tRNA1Val (adenine37-N6)-methyltransferase
MATSLFSPSLVIEQSNVGYRHSIEPFLLAYFANLLPGYRLLDIGTGCGIIPLLTSRKVKLGEIVAIEIQKSLYDLAVINMSKNGILDKVNLFNADFTGPTINPADGLFDTIISNPPYRKLNTGRMNPNQEKAIARHEISMDLNLLLSKTSSLLKHGGTFIMTYPLLRLNEVQKKLCSKKLFPSKLFFIHGTRDADARIFLIEAIKNRKVECVIETPLFLYNDNGSYSNEMEKIYASFNYCNRTHNIEEE